MLEAALIAFSTFFAAISPVDVAAIYPSLAPRAPAARRRRMAVKGVAIAGAILVLFVLAGNPILAALGITLPALRIAGGILLLLMSIDMVFARHSGGVSATEDETEEAEGKPDVSVFPLATPLIAGPGAMGVAVLLTAEAGGDWTRIGIVLAMLVLVLAITLALLIAASAVHRVLGVTGINVITRVVGILLAALAAQFIIDGIKGSGLIA